MFTTLIALFLGLAVVAIFAKPLFSFIGFVIRSLFSKWGILFLVVITLVYFGLTIICA